MIEAAIQQFYADQDPPPEIHVPVAPPDAASARRLAGQKAVRKVHIVVPQRGTKKGMMELAHRNAALGYRQRFDANATANYDALESLAGRPATAEAAAPHRLLRHLDDPGQRNGRVDGGVRRRPHAPQRIPEIQDQAGIRDQAAIPGIAGKFLDDFAAMEQVVRGAIRRFSKTAGLSQI